MKIFASEGQKRAALLSLKLSSFAHLSKLSYEPIPFLLDDFSLFLDEKRMDLLKQYLMKKLDQVMITSATNEWISLTKKKLFFISSGKISLKVPESHHKEKTPSYLF